MPDWTQRSTSPKSSLARGIWMHGFLAGLVVLLLVYLGWFFLKGTPVPSSPGEKDAVSSQGLPPQASPSVKPPDLSAPVASETTKSQLEKVLAGIREANQKKDLALFLSLYTPTSPGLAQRAQEISKSWTIYNYPKMEFTITELNPLSDGRILARVTWDIKMEIRSTKKLRNVSKAYLVWFENDSGHWRIQALEKAG
jgi:hypothetical protein